MKSLLRPTTHRTQRCFLASGCSTYRQVRVRALRGPVGVPSVVRCVRHGSGFWAPRRRRCRSIAEERQQRRRGHSAATLRADGDRGQSLRCSSSTMLKHRLPPCALTSAHEPHRRTALGTPAGPQGRKHHWARPLAGLVTRPHEYCGLSGAAISPKIVVYSACASITAT